jgi:hypothetical protein
MKELDILNEYERVEAPQYFEKGVMNLLMQRKKKKQKSRILRLSLAGAASTLGVLLLVCNIFFFNGKSLQEYAENDTESVQALENYYSIGQGNRIPITEAVDYSREIRKQTNQPVTVYILEQVSEGTDAKIKF